MFTLAVVSSAIRIFPRRQIEAAYCTLFLEGSLIGFAVRDGDDEVPHLADWTTDNIWPLSSDKAAEFRNTDNEGQRVRTLSNSLSGFTMKY